MATKLMALFALRTWRSKLFVLGALPVLLAILASFYAGGLLYVQNATMRGLVDDATARQKQAANSLVAILQLQISLQKLIASASPDDIRNSAIETIKATSLAEENLTHLSENLKDNPKVKKLEASLQKLKPEQMNVIARGKKNDDENAMIAYAGMRNEVENIIALSQEILFDEQALLARELSKQAEANTNSLVLMFAVVMGGLALVIFIVLFFSRSLIAGLTSIKDSMREFARGNLTISAQYNKKDELGDSITALNSAMNCIKNVLETILEQARKLDNYSVNLVNITTTDREHANNIRSFSDSIFDVSNSLGLKADEVSQALDVCVKNTANAADLSGQASKRITKMRNASSNFQQSINAIAEKTHSLHESTETISSITSTIRGISDQTNLLALNAAIEAARAGEQGRGFAVVADEVRSLAQRTNEAVEEISSLAVEISKNIDLSTAAMEKASQQLEETIKELVATTDMTQESERAAETTKKQVENLALLNNEQRSFIREFHGIADKLSHQAQAAIETIDNLGLLSDEINTTSEELVKASNFFKK